MLGVLVVLAVAMKEPFSFRSNTLQNNYEMPSPRYFENRFPSWVEFASNQGCSTNHALYARSDEQWQPFYAVAGINDRMIEAAKALPAVTYVEFGPDGVYSPYNGPLEWLNQLIASMHRLSYIKTLNSKYTMVFNLLDEPRVLYPRKSYGSPAPDHMPAPRVVPLDEFKAACSDPYMAHMFQYHGALQQPTAVVLTELAPVFSPGTLRSCFADIAIPIMEHKRHIVEANAAPSWDDRSPTLVWRGSTSGAPAVLLDYAVHHRYRAVDVARAIPDTDVRFSSYVQCDVPECYAMKQRYPLAPYLQYDKLFHFRYLFDIDGNSYSRRFSTLMSSGSLVIRAQGYHDWLDGILLPNTHYLAVDISLRDLADKLQWAKEHDSEAHSMASAARDFVVNHLRDEDSDCFLQRQLMHYVALVDMTRGIDLN